MLKWCQEIYIGESIEDRSDKIIRMLNAGKAPYMTWLITKSDNGSNQLEIMDAIYLKQKFIRDRLPEIVGLAINKGEAIKMVRAITEACVNMTGDADLVAFLDKHPVIENFKKVSIVK